MTRSRTSIASTSNKNEGGSRETKDFVFENGTRLNKQDNRPPTFQNISLIKDTETVCYKEKRTTSHSLYLSVLNRVAPLIKNKKIYITEGNERK